MIKKWILNPLAEDEKSRNSIKKLSQELNISTPLAKLLVQRGIDDFNKAKKFFRPQLKDIHDPFLMNDMDKAVERLNKAMQNKEKILIYGDYDVDGTSAVALVYKFLNQFYAELDYYIPDRYAEGYGISYTGIDYAAENGFTLVIALDCGIKAVEKVAYAKEKGVDFIICDHHTPDDKLPDAVAVLDQKREDSTYPYGHLSGCGVGFKLMQAFAIKNGIAFEELIHLLDLLSISIASDIVPITGENRILAHYGLKQLNSKPSVGINAMIDICELRGKDITISDIVFKIGPRINASGRIRSGKDAVDLMITKDHETASLWSSRINKYNQERKNLDKKITEEAKVLVNDDYLKAHKSIVVYDKTWSKGVIGIVASRLTEKYYRPSIVLTTSEDKENEDDDTLITGSARSLPGLDIYNAIDSCRDLLENFGGHIYAAGLSLKRKNLDNFMERFENFVASNLESEQQVPIIEIDTEITLDQITNKFYKILKQFEPFGPDNMKPVFCTRNLHDAGGSRAVGKNQEHEKIEVVDKLTGVTLNGIAFGQSEWNDYIKQGNPIDICYTLEENTFNGTTSIQLMIRDIQKSKI